MHAASSSERCQVPVSTDTSGRVLLIGLLALPMLDLSRIGVPMESAVRLIWFKLREVLEHLRVGHDSIAAAARVDDLRTRVHDESPGAVARRTRDGLAHGFAVLMHASSAARW